MQCNKGSKPKAVTAPARKSLPDRPFRIRLGNELVAVPPPELFDLRPGAG
jgi:hypothetical protein